VHPSVSRRLQTLGPFGAVAADIDLDIDVDRETYVVLGPADLLTTLKELGVKPSGRIAYSRTISLEDRTRGAVGIPSVARFYAFVYPLDNLCSIGDDALSRFDLAKPSHCFLTIGGFVYFDTNYNMVQKTSLIGGSAMTFDGPYDLFPQYEVMLVNKARPVSLSELRRSGAVKFMWLPAGMRVGSRSLPHGGFAYVFHDKSCSYFRLLDDTDRHVRQPLPRQSPAKFSATPDDT